jgi:hypothetical protein
MTSPEPQAPQSGSRVRSGASSVAKRIIGLVIGFAIVAGVGYGYKLVKGDPDTAGVGECLAGASADDLKVVKCDDPTAKYKVAGKVEDKTEAEFSASDNNICSAFPNVESGYWKGERGKKGYVLCLAPSK